MKSNQTKLFTILGLGLALLTGCGGGGGGDGSPPSVTYTGVTTEAVVTSDNAAALTAAAADKTAADGLDTIVAAEITEGPRPGGLSLPGLVSLLADMKNLARMAGPATAVGGSVNQSVEGACGGSTTISASNTGDETNVNITGTQTYSNYCVTTPEGNVTVDGSMTFTLAGTFDNYVFTIATSYLSISAGGQTLAYSMNYTFTVNGDAATATMSANYRAPDGKVYRLENYRIEVSNLGYTVSISGRLYHPDYGYVTVTTPTPLEYSSCGSGIYRPTSGILRVTGSGGVYAEFHPQSCAAYQVCHADGTVCVLHNW